MTIELVTGTGPIETGPKTGLRLETLTTVRWVAVVGQTLAVATTHFGFGFDLPLVACGLAIASAATLNVLLGLRRGGQVRLDEVQSALLLSFDILQLTVLLFLTGGLGNPFAFLLLVPVAIAASWLRLPAIIALAALSMICLTVVAVFHLPLPWYASAKLSLPVLYIVGIWLALVSAMAFLTFYAWRIAEESRRMQDALAATEMVLARETQLSALDGLAAAAAHDLGTPLSTIAVVASELKREYGDDPRLADDLALLMSQARRCRTILSTLTAKGSDTLFQRMRLSVALEEVAAPYREMGYTIDVRARAKDGSSSPEPIIPRNPGVLYGLGNLVDNAVDFAREIVSIEATWDDTVIAVDVMDDGPGVASETLSMLGEPFVSRRRRGKAKSGQGLGVFIARTLIERSGGRMTIANRPAPLQGAVFSIRWPREAFDVGLANLNAAE